MRIRNVIYWETEELVMEDFITFMFMCVGSFKGELPLAFTDY